MCFFRKLKLPSINSSGNHNRQKPLSLTLGQPTDHSLDLQVHSMAKLDEETFEKFCDAEDTGDQCIPTCVSWMPGGDFLIGCQGGQIVKVIICLITI